MAQFRGSSRFRIVRELGAGGFGVVYEAEDREGGARVALKTLAHVDPAGIYRFKKEFRAFADVRHPGLVRLHELISEGEEWFFTMELVHAIDWLTYVRGGTGVAAEVAPTVPVGIGGLGAGAGAAVAVCRGDQERIRVTIIQVIEALAALHAAGLVHRDVKPSNVLVTAEGRAVLLDFGIATSIRPTDASLADHDLIVGTPAYMAPEQAVATSLTGAADLYAVGVMLYEALTGSLPFPGMPVHILSEKQRAEPRPVLQATPTAPRDLATLADHLLRRSPEQRPSTKEALASLGTGTGSPMRGNLSPGALPTSASIFVGRADILATMDAALAQARAGTQATVYLHGTSGLGKSATVRTFLDRIATRESPTVVLEGRCYQRESVPYKAFDSLIDRLTRYLLGLSESECSALMPRDAAALARVFPVLHRVPSVAKAPRRVADLPDAHIVRSRAFGALRELLARLADRRTVVLFFDDVQWGDVDSASLLREITSPPDPPPLLILLAYRTEEADRCPFFTSLRRHASVAGEAGYTVTEELKCLPERETRELAARLLGGEEHTRALVESIARESLGIPFFVGELVQYVQTDLGRTGAGGVRLDGLIQKRTSQLGAPAADLLRAACLAGRLTERRVVVRASGLDEEVATQALSELRAGNLIRVTGTRGEWVEPFHDRVREAVVADMSASDVQALHRSIAFALNESDGADPEQLLVHFREAGLTEQALVCAQQAAEKATRALAFDRAADLWGHALSIGGLDAGHARVVKLARADALVNAGRGVLAGQAFLSLAEDARGAAKIDLQRRAGEQLLLAGQIREGYDVMRSVLAHYGLSAPTTPFRALWRLAALRAWVAVRGLSFRPRDESEVAPAELTRLDALLSLSKALTLVDTLYGAYFAVLYLLLSLRSGERFRVVNALAGNAAHHVVRNPRGLSRALAMHAQAHSISEELPEGRRLEGRPFLCFTLALTRYFNGEWQEAAAGHEEALHAWREAGVRVQWDADSSTWMWVLSAARLGAFRLLAERFPVHLRDAVDRGDTYLATILAVSEGSVLWLVRDDPAGGARTVENALSEWSAMRGSVTLDIPRWYGLCSMTMLDLYQRNAQRAMERSVAVEAEVGHSTLRLVPAIRTLSCIYAARAALAVADGRESADALRRGARVARAQVRRASRLSPHYYRPMLDLLSAGVAYAEGNPERSLRLLEDALRACEAQRLAGIAAFARWRLGDVVGGDAGRAHRDAAAAWMREQGVVRPERFVEAHAPGFGGRSG